MNDYFVNNVTKILNTVTYRGVANRSVAVEVVRIYIHFILC